MIRRDIHLAEWKRLAGSLPSERGIGDGRLIGAAMSGVIAFVPHHDGKHVIPDLKPWDCRRRPGSGRKTISGARAHHRVDAESIVFVDQGQGVIIDASLAQVTDKVLSSSAV